MFQKNLGLPRYFYVQRFCFSRVGIDITAEKQVISSYLWNIVPQIALFFLTVALCHYAIEHFEDVNAVTTSLGPVWQIALLTLKWITFMQKRYEVLDLVKIIWTWNLEAEGTELELIIKEQEKDITFSGAYLILVSITGYVVVIRAFLGGLLAYLFLGKYYVETPLLATYPWDMTNPYLYGLGITWTFLAIYFALYITVAIDSLFSWITRSIIAQFSILQLRIKKAARIQETKEAQRVIVDFIKYHLRIIDIIDKLNDVFGIVVFAEFAISCMQICFLAYQLSRARDLGDVIFLVGFLLTVASQLVIFCLSGQRIKDASSDVCKWIYVAYEWDNVSVTLRKLLLMPMVRSQRICELSGVFFHVDLSLYLWVFRTAGSYIALLFSIAEKRI